MFWYFSVGILHSLYVIFAVISYRAGEILTDHDDINIPFFISSLTFIHLNKFSSSPDVCQYTIQYTEQCTSTFQDEHAIWGDTHLFCISHLCGIIIIKKNNNKTYLQLRTVLLLSVLEWFNSIFLHWRSSKHYLGIKSPMILCHDFFMQEQVHDSRCWGRLIYQDFNQNHFILLYNLLSLRKP